MAGQDFLGVRRTGAAYPEGGEGVAGEVEGDELDVVEEGGEVWREQHGLGQGLPPQALAQHAAAVQGGGGVLVAVEQREEDLGLGRDVAHHRRGGLGLEPHQRREDARHVLPGLGRLARSGGYLDVDLLQVQDQQRDGVGVLDLPDEVGDLLARELLLCSSANPRLRLPDDARNALMLRMCLTTSPMSCMSAGPWRAYLWRGGQACRPLLQDRVQHAHGVDGRPGPGPEHELAGEGEHLPASGRAAAS